MASLHWLRQPGWFIKSTGSNRNDGLTANTPIRDGDELRKRWGKTPFLTNPVTVTCLDVPPGQLTFEHVTIAPGGSFTLNGTPTQISTGTIGTVRAANRATQTPWGLDGGLGANVGRRLRITGGARAGVTSWLVKDEGAGETRLTTPGTTNLATFNTFTRTAPVAADPYAIEQLPLVQVGCFDFRLADNTGNALVGVQANDIGLDFEFCTMRGESFGLNTCLVRSLLNFPNTFVGQNLWSNCMVTNGATMLSAATGIIVGGGILNSIFASQIGANITLDFDYLAQASKIVSYGRIVAGTVAVFDVAQACVEVSATGQITSQTQFDTTHLIWGLGSPAAAGNYGIQVEDGGVMRYVTNIPTVNNGRGLGQEVKLGGTDLTYATITGADQFIRGAEFAKAILAP